MNWDCQLLILQQLSFEDLINVSQASKELYYLASNIFRRKYKNTNRVSITYHHYIRSQNWDISHGTLALNHALAEEFLRGFGHLIKRLEIRLANFSPEKENKYGYLINYYCSETLLEFKGQ